MVIATSTQKTKKQKLSKEVRNGKREDGISNLPDHILHHILSFLPTTDAVRTSALAKRWRCLWTSVESLDFLHWESTKEDKVEGRMTFSNSVNRVLLLHDDSDITRFRIKCLYCDATYIDAWISTAIRRKVQELDLHISIPRSYVLPGCLFTCDTLRILKLRVYIAVRLPASICFTALKVLHFSGITFYVDQSIPQVSLSCPILEEYFTDFCVWIVKTINISAPTLEKLTIYEPGAPLFSSEIKFCVGNLISFKLANTLSHKYSLDSPPSLVNASFTGIVDDNYVHHLVPLFRQISTVKNLDLSADILETLFNRDLSAYMLKFPNIIHLSLGHAQMRRTKISGKKLIHVLHNMPTIQCLSFPHGYGSILFEECCQTFGTTPGCFLSNLKIVCTYDFLWAEEDLGLIKFLLKNARVLEKIVIRPMPLRSDNARKMFNKQLRKIARNSKCVIEII